MNKSWQNSLKGKGFAKFCEPIKKKTRKLRVSMEPLKYTAVFVVKSVFVCFCFVFFCSHCFTSGSFRLFSIQRLLRDSSHYCSVLWLLPSTDNDPASRVPEYKTTRLFPVNLSSLRLLVSLFSRNESASEKETQTFIADSVRSANVL